MKVVVPLAGPDLSHPVLGVKALHPVGGTPLLVRALESRPWLRSGLTGDADLVFVLREGPEAAAIRELARARYPGARVVQLSHTTGGALLSALAGAAALDPCGGPLCVDLADIIFSWSDYDPARLWKGATGAVVPVFPSQDPAYSYLRREGGVVVEAAEKRVISSEASAGVYLFASLPVFLAAAAHSIAHADSLAHRGALFVCPAVNGVLAAGLGVAAPQVADVVPVSRWFKEEGP